MTENLQKNHFEKYIPDIEKYGLKNVVFQITHQRQKSKFPMRRNTNIGGWTFVTQS